MMQTLFEAVGSNKRWEEAIAEYAKLHEEVAPLGEDKWTMLHMCLTAFSMARAFYGDCYHQRNSEGDELQKMAAWRGYAESFRNVFLRIGEYRLGTRGPNSRQQALNELEACHRWMKRKGLRGWRVMRYVEVKGSQQSDWEEVEPRVFVSQILNAFAAGEKAKKRVVEAMKTDDEEGNKRGDKYDPENQKEEQE